MKKSLSVILAAITAASMLGATVSAHGGHHNTNSNRQSSKTVYRCTEDCAYCDNDGDGICDSCGNYGYYCKNSDCSYIDEDGDGICDNCDTKGVCSVKPKAKSRCCHR